VTMTTAARLPVGRAVISAARRQSSAISRAGAS
jgi:hypothetical protein